jgi:hypothetical protein
MRSLNLLAEHVVARVPAPELAVDSLGELFRQQGDSTTRVQEEVTGLALYSDVHLPQSLAEALEFDDLWLLARFSGCSN